MDITDLILLAIALGIDCFIVSFSQGLIFRARRRLNSIKLGMTMGIFQGIMPFIGYIAAAKIYNILVPISKYLVFAIFFILGIKFILDAFTNTQKEHIQCISLKCLMILSIATSIDALVSGVPLKFMSTNLLFSCVIIGTISFIMSICGFWIGNFIKNIQTRYLYIIGACILIGLAFKSLFI